MWRPDTKSEWQETWIDPVGVAQQAQQQTWRERLAPACDPLLLACLRVAEQERQQRAAAALAALLRLLAAMGLEFEPGVSCSSTLHNTSCQEAATDCACPSRNGACSPSSLICSTTSPYLLFKTCSHCNPALHLFAGPVLGHQDLRRQ